MNGLKIWTSQDLLHILFIKSLQREAHMPSHMLKRRFWNFLGICHKKKNALKIAKGNSLKTTIHKTRTTLPEVVATFLGSRSPTRFLHFEISPKMKRVEALMMPFTKYNDWSLLANENPISRNAILNLTCYKTLRNMQQINDFGLAPFVPNVQEARREQSTLLELLQHDQSTRSANLGNQTSRNLSSLPSYATRRVFFSKSYTVFQRSVETMGLWTRDSSGGMPSTNVSIVPLRGTQSGNISLTKVRLFSNTSKPRKPTDCKDDNQQKSQSLCESENERKICGEKTLRKGTCGQNNEDTCGKRRKSNLKTCSNRRADLQKERKCSADKKRCCSGKKTDRNCNAKGRSSTRNCASSQDTDTRCCKSQQSKSCQQKKEIDCCKKSKCDKQREDDVTCGKVLKERLKQDREQSINSQKKNCSQSNNQKSHKSASFTGKRRYSQLSFLSNYPRSHTPFGVLNSNAVRDSRASDTTRRFYASCEKDKDDSKSLCEKPKETCQQKERKKECTKGPAKCISKKSVSDKPQTCSSTSEKKKPSEQTTSTCSREQYCANKKGFEDEPKEKCSEAKEESTKERFERECKEMNECKKRHEKTDEKCKRPESKTTCDQSKKKKDNTRNFKGSLGRLRSALNELSFLSRPVVVRDESAIIVRNVRPLDVMFDRSLYTTKAYYQDDFAVKRSADHNETLPSSASGGDFIHGDELPLFVEIENNEEEEADERIDRSAERD